MNFMKAPVAVTDRRRTRTGNAVTVGGNIGKAKSALAPMSSRVSNFITGIDQGRRVF